MVGYARNMIARIRSSRPFRHYIREWREHRGLTQQQLADRLETSKGMISRWESNQRGLTIDVQASLADALDLESPGDIFRNPAARSIDAMLRNSPGMVEEVAAIVDAMLKARRA